MYNTKRTDNPLSILIKVLLYSLIPVALLSLLRAFYIYKYVSMEMLGKCAGDIPKVIYNSLRFDLQTTAYVMIVPTVMFLVSLFISNTKQELQAKTGRLTLKACRIYFSTAATLIAALGVIDLGFYQNFNTHINITFFDFFNEGPVSLIVAIWEDYPVIWIFIVLCMITALAWIAGGYINSLSITTSPQKGRKIAYTAGLLHIVLMVVFMRGSITRFPLQAEDTVVSPVERVNDIIPNATYMLKKAVKDKSMAFKMEPAGNLLREYGFNSIQEALDVYTGHRGGKLSADTIQSLHNALFHFVPDTIKSPQPNVVILLCESWSNYLLTLQNENVDILCGMKKHLDSDIVFRKHQSVCNGTIASIENLSVSTPFPRIFTSKYRFNRMPSSMAIPFKESGYTCEFMTGMDQAWENCGTSLKDQAFDRITGKYELMKRHPEYTANSIGIYDEYLLSSLLEQINAKTRKPQMIFCMTTTNHPPFELPEETDIPELPDSFLESRRFEGTDKEVVRKYISTFQYFNKNLAIFLDKFKASPAAKNTVLVITGDHNVRTILNYNNIGAEWKNSVPLYIYLPPYLRKNEYSIDTNKYGCHYDIMPTIAPLAFKGTEYFRLGKNLLDERINIHNSYSYNEQQVLADKKFRKVAEKENRARTLLLKLYFQMVFRQIDNSGKYDRHISHKTAH